MTQELDDSPLREIPNTFSHLSERFSSYWSTLKSILQEKGIDWRETYGLDEQHPSVSAKLNAKDVKELSRQVSMDLMGFSDGRSSNWINRKEEYDTALGQAVSCLRWYGPMVGAKFARIIRSSKEDKGMHDNDTPSPTIKLLHLILARAIAAATLIMQETRDSRKLLVPLVLDYCRLLNYLRIKYPKAHLLQRTAFDNPRYTKEIRTFYNDQLPIDPFRDNSWSAGGRAPSE